ncbi:hypothetical protein LEP1GSC170_3017 [Leptospira interrogans serovar Bataviae str. HAI135]|nr:hypothetical protein LEP1GSC170_3017 [Leptospira interrogans serovar Bataviae str. HAI135]
MFVTGGPGSGKTFVSNLIASLSGTNPQVFIIDSDYYENQKSLESILSVKKMRIFFLRTFQIFQKKTKRIY